ncbi:MAG: hypothetical protein ACOX8B_09915 [Lachnospiraceae bacterium]|jgi:hypothetical protein
MVSYDTLLSLSFLKLSRFTGSDEGMRYCVQKTGTDEEPQLEVLVWPGPFALEMTKPELFQKASFPFSDEGRRQCVDWINAMHEKDEALYRDIQAHASRYFGNHIQDNY